MVLRCLDSSASHSLLTERNIVVDCQFIRSDPTPEDLRLIGPSLQLNEGPFRDLGWLHDLSDRLVELVVTATVNDSIESINCLSQLRLLRVWTYNITGCLDLERLPHLERLALHGGVKVNWGKGGQQLRELTIESPPQEWAAHIESLPRLESLGLARSKFVPHSFAGAITELDLSMMKWPPGVSAVRGLEELVTLELTSVRGITDLSPFAETRGLAKVVIEDCPHFTSLKGAKVNPDAQVFLIGRTPARRAR